MKKVTQQATDLPEEQTLRALESELGDISKQKTEQEDRIAQAKALRAELEAQVKKANDDILKQQQETDEVKTKIEEARIKKRAKEH